MPRNATMTARTDCLLLTLTGQQSVELVQEASDLRARIEAVAAQRGADPRCGCRSPRELTGRLWPTGQKRAVEVNRTSALLATAVSDTSELENEKPAVTGFSWILYHVILVACVPPSRPRQGRPAACRTRMVLGPE